MTKVFINGEFVNEEDAKVSYEDRGYVFGDGIYEYIRAYDGKLFTVKEHFERFLRSAEEIGLDLNYTIEAVSYTHLTLPTTLHECRSRWSPYH